MQAKVGQGFFVELRSLVRTATAAADWAIGFSPVDFLALDFLVIRFLTHVLQHMRSYEAIIFCLC